MIFRTQHGDEKAAVFYFADLQMNGAYRTSAGGATFRDVNTVITV